ncbi:MAG: hypothetical protein AAGI03_08005 [Pseudomonadota bacterium]
MMLRPSEAVHEVHRLALQQALTRSLKTDRDWARFNAIVEEAATRVDAEKADFRHDYQTRLAEARQTVLREQSKHSFDHPAPTGTTRTPLSPERVDILAMNRVQADHEKRIAAIRQDEVDGYHGLSADVRARDERASHARAALQGQAREAFNRTNQISPHAAQTRGRTGPSRS